MEEKKKEIEKIYRLTVWSHYEEDSGEPYFVDFDSEIDAYNAKFSYESELTLYGQHAYSVCGPDVITLSDKFILIKTDNSITTVDIEDDKLLDKCHELLQCECIRVVSINLADVLIVDDSGKLKDKEVNAIASCFYPGIDYSDPIVGHVLLCRRNGPELEAIPGYALETYLSNLQKIKDVICVKEEGESGNV